MELLIAALGGGFVSVAGYAWWVQYQKREKARALRSIVKAAERIKDMGDDGDAVERSEEHTSELQSQR